MLFTLGLGSATALIGSVITIINDEWPKLRRTYVTATICTVSFLVGVIYTTPVR